MYSVYLPQELEYLGADNQTFKDPTLCLTYGSIQVFMGVRFSPYAGEFMNRFISYYEHSPLKLTHNLKAIYCPSFSVGGIKPEGICYGAIAYPDTGSMLIQPDPFLNFTPFTFAHECAHLAGFEAGPDPELGWTEARFLDKQHNQDFSFKRLRTKLEEHRYYAGSYKALRVGCPWITDYAELMADYHFEAEDWADATALFLYDQQAGYLHRLYGRKVRFGDLYPHRAKLLTSWINS